MIVILKLPVFMIVKLCCLTCFLYDSAAHVAAGLFMVPLSTLCSMLLEEASSHVLICNKFLC